MRRQEEGNVRVTRFPTGRGSSTPLSRRVAWKAKRFSVRDLVNGDSLLRIQLQTCTPDRLRIRGSTHALSRLDFKFGPFLSSCRKMKSFLLVTYLVGLVALCSSAIELTNSKLSTKLLPVNDASGTKDLDTAASDRTRKHLKQSIIDDNSEEEDMCHQSEQWIWEKTNNNPKMCKYRQIRGMKEQLDKNCTFLIGKEYGQPGYGGYGGYGGYPGGSIYGPGYRGTNLTPGYRGYPIGSLGGVLGGGHTGYGYYGNNGYNPYYNYGGPGGYNGYGSIGGYGTLGIGGYDDPYLGYGSYSGYGRYGGQGLDGYGNYGSGGYGGSYGSAYGIKNNYDPYGYRSSSSSSYGSYAGYPSGYRGYS
ncbi:shematrin-like protein 1 isoform X2 [Vespula maculifrons]|uniref:Shematrin-like protein 1 isoform X2 n=1 Tax=Vespula maculifrons TaxID=7453 RepID=A0ABD2CX34_VESMC